MSRALRIHPRDNVAVALEELMAGLRAEVVSDEGTRELLVVDTVPFGHKVAVEEIDEGADVRKYGVPIGFATRTIHAGRVGAPAQHAIAFRGAAGGRSVILGYGRPVGTGRASATWCWRFTRWSARRSWRSASRRWIRMCIRWAFRAAIETSMPRG